MFDPRWKVLLGSESREAYWCGLGDSQQSYLEQEDIFRSHPSDLMV